MFSSISTVQICLLFCKGKRQKRLQSQKWKFWESELSSQKQVIFKSNHEAIESVGWRCSYSPSAKEYYCRKKGNTSFFEIIYFKKDWKKEKVTFQMVAWKLKALFLLWAAIAFQPFFFWGTKDICWEYSGILGNSVWPWIFNPRHGCPTFWLAWVKRNCLEPHRKYN